MPTCPSPITAAIVASQRLWFESSPRTLLSSSVRPELVEGYSFFTCRPFQRFQSGTEFFLVEKLAHAACPRLFRIGGAKRHALGAQIFVSLIHVHAAHGAYRLFSVSQNHRALRHQFARDDNRFVPQLIRRNRQGGNT